MTRHGSSFLSAPAIAPRAMMQRDLSAIFDAADASPGRSTRRPVAPKPRAPVSIATLHGAGRAPTRTGEKSKSP